MSIKIYVDKYDFEELFYSDVESWFSADIACCDNCYDDFLGTWPLVYSADDAEFQKRGIDLQTFYSGSNLQDYYSEEEFTYFISQVNCPRCNTPLSGNIWPYELPFSTDISIESTINNLAKIASKTPFLLLNHSFSEKVYSAIKRISKIIKPITVHESLYRARTIILSKPSTKDFDFPPKEFVKEGRYNHAGIPVLYLASDKKTCFYEMRETPCTIAEIKVKKRLKILDLVNVGNYDNGDDDILKTLVYSTLTSSTQDGEGWHKPKYVFTRFISDCALDSGFHAIKYPSTRLSFNNYNLVILDSTISLAKDCSIKKYYKIKDIKDI